MTACDVLMTRVHDAGGTPMFVPQQTMGAPGEPLWAISAEGHESLIVHPFTEALDVALAWAGESGGRIYRRDRPGGEAAVYNAAW